MIHKKRTSLHRSTGKPFAFQYVLFSICASQYVKLSPPKSYTFVISSFSIFHPPQRFSCRRPVAPALRFHPGGPRALARRARCRAAGKGAGGSSPEEDPEEADRVLVEAGGSEGRGTMATEGGAAHDPTGDQPSQGSKEYATEIGDSTGSCSRVRENLP